jgi:uncharacterized protein YukJ
MSCILYYSKYCEISKNYLQLLSKSNVQKDIHFICIDKRVKEANNKTYIILDNGQKIILPENITRVPALLLLTEGYKVLYGESILGHLKPREEIQVRQATQNNMEPMAFSFGGGFNDIVSDQFSFLDQQPEDLEAKGNGGMRQMHNYVDLTTAFSGEISNHAGSNDTNTTIRGSKKIPENDSNQVMENTIKKMKEERDADLMLISGNKPPLSYK